MIDILLALLRVPVAPHLELWQIAGGLVVIYVVVGNRWDHFMAAQRERLRNGNN